MDLNILHNQLARVAPISGVSVRDVNDKNTWRIDYDKPPTAEEEAAARAVIANYVAITKEQQIANSRSLKYLNDSEPDVLLHLEQLAAEINTTLTADQFKELCIERARVRNSIVKEGTR